MKRVYSKPEIFFESFKLSSNIATCEGLKGNNIDASSCELDIGENNMSVIVFNATVNVNCDVDCYHGPMDATTVFGS